MSALDRAFDFARERRVRVVFPEWDDPRIVEARTRLEAEGLCIPVPLSTECGALGTVLTQARGMKDALARRMLAKPLIRAAAMVTADQADVMVAGIASPTRRVIEAAGLAIGLASGVSTPSSFFLMRFPGGDEFVFADCAVNIDPDVKQLADIARASARSAKALLGEARVALLSFATGTSGTGPSVNKVAEVARETGFAGPLQADAALNATIAVTKGIAPVDANTLVFPSLDAGNIAYKLCQELAGAQAVGPLLQGFARPVCDLSRGATPDDIVAATVLTIALADPRPA